MSDRVVGEFAGTAPPATAFDLNTPETPSKPDIPTEYDDSDGDEQEDRYLARQREASQGAGDRHSPYLSPRLSGSHAATTARTGTSSATTASSAFSSSSSTSGAITTFTSTSTSTANGGSASAAAAATAPSSHSFSQTTHSGPDFDDDGDNQPLREYSQTLRQRAVGCLHRIGHYVDNHWLLFWGLAAVVVLLLIIGLPVISLSQSCDNDENMAEEFYFPSTEASQAKDTAFLKLFDNTESLLRQDLTYISAKTHLAGTPNMHDLANWMKTQLLSYGISNVSLDTFEVLLPFPPARASVQITAPEELRWTALNQESEVSVDPTSSPSNNNPPFHGFSAAGVVEGPAVYVNYGREEDYAVLTSLGVNLTGTIVLARYGKIFRADKCLLAAKHGAVGCLVYSDPADDGFARGPTYPDGPWRPQTGVQRGTIWVGNGDPLTPSWPAVASAPRLSLEEAQTSGIDPLPSIPTHPLSWGDASRILSGISGGATTPNGWAGAIPNVAYALGPGPVIVNMDIESNISVAAAHQVVATIPGTVEPDRYVIMGAHRDAWSLGAMDPGGGTIMLMNVARAFGKLLATGWQPRRTIVFVSHDAEEPGLIGSVEWVERHATALKQRGVTYINVDTPMWGLDYFEPGGTPTLKRLIRAAATLTPSPRNTSQSVLDMWEEADQVMEGLAAGSDFLSFVQLGIPSADIGFGGTSGYSGVYHSAYDSLYWVTHFGDTDFRYHRLLSGLVGLMVLHLADDVVLPFDYSDYVPALQLYVAESKALVQQQIGHPDIDFTPLEQAVAVFNTAAEQLRDEIKQLDAKTTAAQIRALNDRLMLAERTVTNFPRCGRDWMYTHAFYSPGKYDQYDSVTFPVLSDAIHERNWSKVSFQVQMLSVVIRSFASSLLQTPFFL